MVLVYDQSYDSADVDLGIYGTIRGRGQMITSSSSTLIGKNVQKMIIYMKKLGTCQGNIVSKIVKSDGTEVTIGSMTANSVSTTYTAYTFEDTNITYTLQNGDVIAVELSEPGLHDTSNNIQVKAKNSDIVSGSAHTDNVNGTWGSHSAYESMAFQLDDNTAAPSGDSTIDDSAGRFNPEVLQILQIGVTK